ncbi:glycoside hydrolase family 43 protein [Tuanshanicoccus lijuaniae]|uniref:glycoside hydrolase family 43 protein n=1 Tax=Aerococcaceae bacterium zg-1292 TaxID=2774330 RepID=UPI004063B4C7
MFKRLITIAVVMFFMSLNYTSVLAVTYHNPVGDMTDIGDPFVIKTNNKYYMYATSEPNFGFRVWSSTNLVDWMDEGIALDHRDFEKKWALRDFWAPEVFEKDGAYYMTYSARAYNGSLRIAIAKSESPLGPFVDVNSDLINEKGSYIDGHIFEDEGRYYLYYVKDNYENVVDGQKVSHLYVQELSADLSKVIGEPVFLFGPSQEWEGLDGDVVWNEGPFVLKHDKRYYLMYSANFYASSDYAIGYAVADNPMGPFEKYEHNPIVASDLEKGISGPGHNSVVKGLDDKTLYMVYHIHTDPEHPSGDRRMAIDELVFEEGVMKLVGPTATDREVK